MTGIFDDLAFHIGGWLQCTHAHIWASIPSFLDLSALAWAGKRENVPLGYMI